VTGGDLTSDASIALVRRATWVGLVANVVLATGKIAAGILGGSQAVVADGVHSISDLGTDLVVLLGTRVWAQPADDRHPHGHRRFETLVTVVIGVSLGAVGIGMGWEAMRNLLAPRSAPPGTIALAAAVASVLIKEALYHWTRARADAAESPALRANAWHHRTDAFSSIPAIVAVGGAILLPSVVWLDRAGAVVVCGFILWAAVVILKPALAELVDEAAPESVQRELVELALRVDGVQSAHALRTRFMGASLAVDLHVEVDPKLTVAEGYQIAQAVQWELKRHGPSVADVMVQIEPEPGA
jgi:cation diffusion facilitator family transporter